MTAKTRLATVSALLLVLVAAAFAVERVVIGSDTDTYSVRVSRDGRILKDFDLKELRSMKMRTVIMQGKPEEGPSLLAVLRAAGVEEGDFRTVTFVGMGIRDDGELELKAGDIGEDVLLDVAKHGTVKVCGPDIVREDRVRDVTEIHVR